jgi:hypothetical protein
MMEITCKLCGQEDNCKWLEPVRSRMISKQHCFYCNHWDEIAERFEAGEQFVFVEGKSYMDGGNKSSLKGFGGRKFIIKFFNGTILESTNLWTQGIIPERFRTRLKDNAEFTNRS